MLEVVRLENLNVRFFWVVRLKATSQLNKGVGMRYSGEEVFFDRNDLIVSKTDLKGLITYANHTFLEVAGYVEADVVGKPHNVIRHSNMPRGVFEMFWKTLEKGKEIFAYVVNSTKSGDHYWVIAHVTPSLSEGRVIGYHSTRRVPNSNVIREVIEPLYDELNMIEERSHNRKEGTAASFERLDEILTSKGVGYDEFVSTLMRGN